MAEQEQPITLTKKEKQALKHELFLRRMCMFNMCSALFDQTPHAQAWRHPALPTRNPMGVVSSERQKSRLLAV